MRRELHVSARSVLPTVEVDLEVSAGRTLAILGPNGAGKSTLLSIIAGLSPGPSSQVRLGDRVLTSEAVFVAPHRRSVGLLAQAPRLFPHRTVRSNVAYGPRSARRPRREVQEVTDRWMRRVGVDHLADRRPHQLSGGQAQRVALARALAAEPEVLLLDEPFAALDVSVARELRAVLSGLLADRGGITVLVTHDLVDAVTLAQDVIVLDDGKAVDRGPTVEVISRPTHPFTAELSGRNLVVGRFAKAGTSPAVETGDGRRVVGVAGSGISPGSTAAAAFSPRAVAVYRHAPQGSPRNVLPVVVTEVNSRGDHALVGARWADQLIWAEVTWAAVAELGVAVGQEAVFVVKAGEVQVYPLPPTGAAPF